MRVLIFNKIQGRPIANKKMSVIGKVPKLTDTGFYVLSGAYKEKPGSTKMLDVTKLDRTDERYLRVVEALGDEMWKNTYGPSRSRRFEYEIKEFDENIYDYEIKSKISGNWNEVYQEKLVLTVKKNIVKDALTQLIAQVA